MCRDQDEEISYYNCSKLCNVPSVPLLLFSEKINNVVCVRADIVRKNELLDVHRGGVNDFSHLKLPSCVKGHLG